MIPKSHRDGGEPEEHNANPDWPKVLKEANENRIQKEEIEEKMAKGEIIDPALYTARSRNMFGKKLKSMPIPTDYNLLR